MHVCVCVCVPGMCGSSSPVGIFHWSTCSFRALTSSMSPGTLGTEQLQLQPLLLSHSHLLSVIQISAAFTCCLSPSACLTLSCLVSFHPEHIDLDVWSVFAWTHKCVYSSLFVPRLPFCSSFTSCPSSGRSPHMSPVQLKGSPC